MITLHFPTTAVQYELQLVYGYFSHIWVPAKTLLNYVHFWNFLHLQLLLQINNMLCMTVSIKSLRKMSIILKMTCVHCIISIMETDRKISSFTGKKQTITGTLIGFWLIGFDFYPFVRCVCVMFTAKILALEKTVTTLSMLSLVDFDPFACLVSIVFTAKPRRRPVSKFNLRT